MMFGVKLILFVCVCQSAYGDWENDWLLPVQDQLKDPSIKKLASANEDHGFLGLRSFSGGFESEEPEDKIVNTDLENKVLNNVLGSKDLKKQLEKALADAKALAQVIKTQIDLVSAKEKLLKEAIAYGRSGVSTVTVSTTGHKPRIYMVRDGTWFFCNGKIRFPNPDALSSFHYPPKCVGKEVLTSVDNCAYNSVIKYQVIPSERGPEYTESDYLCLQQAFNNTLERYLTVPKTIIGKTCKSGVVRSLEDNTQECGQHVVSDYTYYPNKNIKQVLPMEYCMEKDGSCKLIVAWHISNSTVENFELLRNDEKFKEYFKS